MKLIVLCFERIGIGLNRLHLRKLSWWLSWLTDAPWFFFWRRFIKRNPLLLLFLGLSRVVFASSQKPSETTSKSPSMLKHVCVFGQLWVRAALILRIAFWCPMKWLSHVKRPNLRSANTILNCWGWSVQKIRRHSYFYDPYEIQFFRFRPNCPSCLFLWFSNTNGMTLLAQNFTIVNWPIVVDRSSVSLQVETQETRKVTDL